MLSCWEIDKISTNFIFDVITGHYLTDLAYKMKKSALLLSSLHVSVVECRHEPFLLVLEFFPGCGALLFGQIFVRLVLGDRTNDEHQVTKYSLYIRSYVPLHFIPDSPATNRGRDTSR